MVDCLRYRKDNSPFRSEKQFIPSSTDSVESKDGQKRVGQIKEQFDLVIHNDTSANIEFWFARELMPLLGYERWENFDKAISRAIDSCETSGIEVSDHFREVTKMITTGKGAQRPVKDFMCYCSQPMSFS